MRRWEQTLVLGFVTALLVTPLTSGLVMAAGEPAKEAQGVDPASPPLPAHLAGGVMALAGVLFIGPRIGKFNG